MPALGYKMESLGIPGLSNAERVNAPKQKFTNTAVMKGNPYPSKWEQVGKAINTSVQAAISGMQAVVSHTNYDNAKLLNEKRVDDAYVTSVTNDAAEALTKVYTSEATARAEGINYNPATFLGKYTEERDRLVNDITNNDNLNEKAKQKAILNVDKLFNKDIMSKAKETEIKIKKDNIKLIGNKILNSTTHMFASEGFALKDIVSTNKDNIDALKKNGVDTDVFSIMNESISMYSDNESVVTRRYNEAKQYLDDYTKDSDKEIPKGFIKYLNTLTSYKNKIDENKTKYNKNKKNALKQDAKRRLQFIEINGAIPVDNVNFKGVAAVSMMEGNKNGVDSELFSTDNINKLKSIVSKSVVTSTKDLALNAGFTPKQYNNYVDRVTDKILVKQLSLHLSNTLGSDIPIDMYPSDYRSMVTDDLKKDIVHSIDNGLVDTIHESFRYNPKIVKAVVQNRLTTDFYNTMSNLNDNNYEQARKHFVSLYGSIDKTISLSGLPANVRLQVETFMNTEDYKAAVTRINNIKETEVTSIKLLGEPNAIKKLKELPYFLGKDAEEYFKLKINTGGGFVTEDDVEEYTESHTLKTGVYGFRSTTYFDNDVNKIVPNESDKLITLDVFKSKLNIDNFDGTHITTSNGAIVVENSKGIVIGAMNTKEFNDVFSTMKRGITYRKLKEKQWDKMEGEASWSSTGFDLGKMDSYIDKQDGTRIYKNKFLKQ